MIMSSRNTYIEIGNTIRAYREKKGMTQLELARLLGYDTSQFVSLFERGLSKAPLEVLGRLVVILGLPEKNFKSLILKDFQDEVNERLRNGKKSVNKAK